jgi:hypothetical protein
VYEALDEPAAEEASAAGDEDALIAHVVPERSRLAEDEV